MPRPRGQPHCPNCGKPISRQTPQQIVDQVLSMEEGTRFQVLAPVVRARKGEYVDLLLTPITNGPPLPARPWHERSFVANVTASSRWAPWASPWNLAGVPALVLPVGRRPEGWPLAVQFAGPPGAEGRLLWLAAELERRQPWRRHAPVFDPAVSSMAPSS